MTEKPHGIMFHHFHDDDIHIKGQGSIDIDQFRRMMLWLKNNYNLLSAEDWYKKAKENKLNKKDICITFDDNLKCQFDIALPVLEEFNIQAFWFVHTSPFEGVKEKLEIYRYFRFSEFADINEFYKGFNETLWRSEYSEEVKEGLKSYNSSEFLKHFDFYTEEDKLFRFIRDQILGIEKYYLIMDQMISDSKMNVDEVSEILWNTTEDITYLDKTGHIIGLHSHSHPTEIKKLPYDEQMDEYRKCYHHLSNLLGKNIKAMAHPCNSYNSDTLDVLKKLDVTFGFRANMEEGFTSTLEYPRMDHTYLISKI